MAHAAVADYDALAESKKVTSDQRGIDPNVHLTVNSPNVTYSDEYITAKYLYNMNNVAQQGNTVTITPTSHRYVFRTKRKVPKHGVMLVGWGGNNGSTVTGAVLANKNNISWDTKSGTVQPNYFGSLTQATTIRIGTGADGKNVHVPFSNLVPQVHPNNLAIGGWDINKANLADAMKRAEVFDWDLQRRLRPHMEHIVPLPSIYYPDFIASNQGDRADNCIPGEDKQAHLEHIRKDIREFKAKNGLDSVTILWTANTERFADVRPGLNDTADNLLASIKKSDPEVAPSQIFAVAAILEGCNYINGSPQNTLVPGVIELAAKHGVFVTGDDFKSGQTKIKSVLVDFLVSSGIKPESIVSYNHLGNNDGKNLSEQRQFRSKEISKSNVVDDMVAANHILFPNPEKDHPDHCVVIKYVPFVKDSKRAMDEYTSSIFMHGLNTITIHNVCEDSLLAAPLILDLVILSELMSRIQYKSESDKEFHSFETILSICSWLLKAPMVPKDTPVVNALFKQHRCITNILCACVGLPPDDDMLLEHKTKLPQSHPYAVGF